MKGMVLDLDGVLKRGGEAIPGSVDAVNTSLENGYRICYLTNNSTKTRKQVMISLNALGYPTAPVVTSAFGSAIYIKEKMGHSRCLVIGEMGLLRELQMMGHEAISGGEGRNIVPVERSVWLTDTGEELSDIEVDCVVAGLDRSLTYTRISDALWCIENGAELIATNRDPTLPWEGGRILPGAGAIISALEACSGVDATIVGKPNPYTTYLAANEMGLDTSDTLMIGDRPDTDIAAGRAAGCMVARVLTGQINTPLKDETNVFKDLKELVDTLIQ